LLDIEGSKSYRLHGICLCIEDSPISNFKEEPFENYGISTCYIYLRL